jgi:copper chaperone CopZ
MRHSIRLVGLLVLGMIVAAGCQSTAKPDGSAGASDTQTLTLVVQGLSCPLCAHNLDKQLLGTAGIVGANVNLSDGTVLVRFRKDQRPSRERLDKVVANAGFTLINVR